MIEVEIQTTSVIGSKACESLGHCVVFVTSEGISIRVLDNELHGYETTWKIESASKVAVLDVECDLKICSL